MKPWLPLLVLPLLAACSDRVLPTSAPVSVQPMSLRLASDIYIEIDPRLELLAGVQSWTSWTESGQPGDLTDNRSGYAQEMKRFFSPWKKSDAVRLAESLQKAGFGYDAPPTLMLYTDNGLAFDLPSGGLPAKITERAQNARKLVSFANALRNLAADSDFPAFFGEHRLWYETLAKNVSTGLSAERVSAWLKEYYGASGHQVFHYVLAPAMMPSGGYGPSRTVTEHGVETTHVYQIVRDATDVDAASLDSLALHEFGHTYVNPAIGGRIPDGSRAALERIFAPVAGEMRRLTYSGVDTFLNEMVIRAATIRARIMLGFIPAGSADAFLAVEEERGFYCIGETYRLLGEYEANRETWPDFSSFGPYLTERLAGQADDILDRRKADAPLDLARPLVCDFENSDNAPGPGLSLTEGVQTGPSGIVSEVFIDAGKPAGGAASLTFRGNADTTFWWMAGRELSVRKGTLSASYKARTDGVRQEGTQYRNSWIGFILTDGAGKRTFKVDLLEGSQDWKAGTVSVEVDPAKVAAIKFGIINSMTGELSVDDITVRYEP